MRNVPNKIVNKITTHSSYAINLLLNSCRLSNNVPKGSAAQQAADCNIVRYIKMRFIWWVNKAKNTHCDYVICICFPRSKGLGEGAFAIPYLCIAFLVSQYANSAVDNSIIFLNIVHVHPQHTAVIYTSDLVT
jgi:hypothetical protein